MGIFKKNRKFDDKLDMKEVNASISLLRKILELSYVFIVILAVYAVIIVSKELKLMQILGTILSIIAPVFIGIIIAWLFNPVVNWFQKHKVRRSLATFIVYFVIILIVTLLLIAFVPVLISQINQFINKAPSIYTSMTGWVKASIESISNVIPIDAKEVEKEIFGKLADTFNKTMSTLPTNAFSVIQSFVSGLGKFLVGLVIGFFFLVGFDNMDSIIGFLPKKTRETTKQLCNKVDGSLRNFVVGSIIDCSFIFIITTIGLWLIGFDSPLMFGLFCGITNFIPYIGPYIGGVPAVIVGFSQSLTIGILTAVVIIVIQTLEGNLLQPMILSKTTKLHPVTIIVGLLIFGYFFGMLGMIISTPVIAALKAILLFFNEKYDIIEIN